MSTSPSPSPYPAASPSAAAAEAPLLVLASQSPSRVRILQESGIRFSQLVSGVDEDAALAQAAREAGHPLSPAQTALALARAKAEAVAAEPAAAGRLVLGCDSVFELDGQAYGKPFTEEVAVQRISAMSGRTGTLHTGHWLVDGRGQNRDAGTAGEGPGAGERHPGSGAVPPGEALPQGAGELRSAQVAFAPMDPAEIRAYAATGEPLHVAGSFTIEGYGAAFIAGIQGESHTVLGLSVHALRQLLGQYGLRITDFWGAGA